MSMGKQRTENREQRHSKAEQSFCSLFTVRCSRRASRGFTLIETLVAISLLTIAIVAPMLLTVQSLSAGYYARDQITAFYLAQEAIETVHAIRDGQILQIAQTSSGSSIDIFGPIPINQNFTLDARQQYSSANPPPVCTGTAGACAPLQTDGQFYGYPSAALGDAPSAWSVTSFTRTVRACYVQPNQPGACTGAVSDEMRVSVTVSWQTGAYQQRSFTISENLYRWVLNGAAS